MGIFSNFKPDPKYGASPGTSFGVRNTKDAIREFNDPKTQGLSDAERNALNEQRQAEEARRRRMLDAQQRRTRVALGSLGGNRTLLYGNFTGTATAATGVTGPNPGERTLGGPPAAT